MNNTKGMTENGTAYNQKHWVIARDTVPANESSEEVKFVEESGKDLVGEDEEVVESIGSNSPSLAGVDNTQSLIKNGITFRPFTPPFAQLQSSPGKIMQASLVLATGEKEMGEKKAGKTLDEGGIEFREGINEVFEEDEGKIDVVYDPILKCYYDPKTNTYYQVDTKIAAS